MEKIHHQDLKDIIKSIKEKNYITIEEFNELKYYSIQPGGFSQKNKNSMKIPEYQKGFLKDYSKKRRQLIKNILK